LREIGSCESTITTVLTKKTIPIAVSLTPASFFAYAGRSSKPAKPAKMRSAFSPITRMKAPLRSTSAYRPGVACSSDAPRSGAGTKRNRITR